MRLKKKHLNYQGKRNHTVIFSFECPVLISARSVHVLYSPCLYCANVMYFWLAGSSMPKTASRLVVSNKFDPLWELCWEIFIFSSWSIRKPLGSSEWKNQSINHQYHSVKGYNTYCFSDPGNIWRKIQNSKRSIGYLMLAAEEKHVISLVSHCEHETDCNRSLRTRNKRQTDRCHHVF